MVTKLTVRGHVHGDPERKVSSSYTWPKGTSEQTMLRIVSSHIRAFANTSFDYE